MENEIQVIHIIQAGNYEFRPAWTAANYAATYLNPTIAPDARYEAFVAAQFGCMH